MLRGIVFWPNLCVSRQVKEMAQSEGELGRGGREDSRRAGLSPSNGAFHHPFLLQFVTGARGHSFPAQPGLQLSAQVLCPRLSWGPSRVGFLSVPGQRMKGSTLGSGMGACGAGSCPIYRMLLHLLFEWARSIQPPWKAVGVTDSSLQPPFSPAVLGLQVLGTALCSHFQH